MPLQAARLIRSSPHRNLSFAASFLVGKLGTKQKSLSTAERAGRNRSGRGDVFLRFTYMLKKVLLIIL